jgi:hypothetical protein
MEQKTNNMAFKMKGHTLPGIKQRNGGKVDLDAPGTPGKPGYEPPVHAMDYLTRTPVGPVAEKKSTYDEEEEQIIENMDNAKDNNFSTHGHMEIGINKGKKKSPAKCPLLAALPMITQAAGAIGAVASAKKAMDK